MKIIKNPNYEVYKKITKAVKENQGYCPCMLVKNKDTKCICKAFREQNEEGYCHCKRFYKVIDNKEKNN